MRWEHLTLGRILNDADSQLRVAHALVVVPALYLLADALVRWMGATPPLRLEALSAAALYVASLRFFPLDRKPVSWPILGASIAVVAILWGSSACLYDTSWDGTSYHLPALLALAEGWNPIMSAAPVEPADLNPNGIWSIRAALFLLLHSVEGAKAFNGVLAFAAFLTLLPALSWILGHPLRRLELAAVCALAANPVAMAQLFTFYVDGAFYEAGLILLAALLLVGSPHRRAALGLAGASIILLAGAKLTAAYFGLALPALAIIATWRRIPSRGVVVAVVLGAFAVGTLAVGFRPYVTSFRDYGARPLRQDADDRPPALAAFSPPEMLFWGVLGRTAAYGDETTLKSPLSMTRHELRVMGSPDPRIGGFGPFFALEVLASAFLLIMATAQGRGRALVHAAPFWLGIGLVAICAVFPEPWWARLIPFLWAAPLFGAIAALSVVERAIGLRALTALILVLACLNSSLAFAGNLARTVLGDWRMRGLLQRLESEHQEIVLVPLPSRAFEITAGYRLRQAGIGFRVALPAGPPTRSPECGRLIKSERLAYCVER